MGLSPGSGGTYIVDGSVTYSKLGGAAKLWEVLADTTLGSAAATIDFSSIATGYKMFKLIVSAGNSGAAQVSIGLRFNADAGANYAYTFLRTVGSTVTGNTITGATEMYFWHAENSATQMCPGEIIIYNVAADQKTASGFGGWPAGSVHLASGKWSDTTNEINQITLVLSSNNFVAGSRAILLGLPI